MYLVIPSGCISGLTFSAMFEEVFNGTFLARPAVLTPDGPFFNGREIRNPPRPGLEPHPTSPQLLRPGPGKRPKGFSPGRGTRSLAIPSLPIPRQDLRLGFKSRFAGSRSLDALNGQDLVSCKGLAQPLRSTK